MKCGIHRIHCPGRKCLHFDFSVFGVKKRTWVTESCSSPYSLVKSFFNFWLSSSFSFFSLRCVSKVDVSCPRFRTRPLSFQDYFYLSSMAMCVWKHLLRKRKDERKGERERGKDYIYTRTLTLNWLLWFISTFSLDIGT